MDLQCLWPGSRACAHLFGLCRCVLRARSGSRSWRENWRFHGRAQVCCESVSGKLCTSMTLRPKDILTLRGSSRPRSETACSSLSTSSWMERKSSYNIAPTVLSPHGSYPQSKGPLPQQLRLPSLLPPTCLSNACLPNVQQSLSQIPQYLLTFTASFLEEE